MPLDDEPQSDPLPDLVAQILSSDEQLDRDAHVAGLDKASLVKELREREADPDAQGSLDLRRRLDEAKRELARAEEAWAVSPEPAVARMPVAPPLVLAVIAATVTNAALSSRNEQLAQILAGAWIAAFIVFAVVRTVARLRYQASVADLGPLEPLRKAVARHERELAQDRVDNWITPQIRAAVGRGAPWRLNTTLDKVDYQGLTGDDPQHAIGTDARARLDKYLENKDQGSIGLSGPRGAGKTSLIRARCPEGDLDGELFGVIVTAPVQFDPREFVLHLLGKLCAAVLGRDGVEQARRPQAAGRRRSTELLLPAVALVSLLAGAGILLVAEGIVSDDHAWAVALAATGVLLGVAAFVRAWPRARAEASSSAFPPIMQAHARDRLRDIWFQQSFTSGWSGALKLPVGFEGGVEGTQELSRQQMSLPDVVDEIDAQIAEVVATGRRVRIGIDELDKLADTDKARQFLNEMKVLFGIPKCFWLVSISEDAMSSFERRGLPLRDEFDSSFTDVVHVSPQTAEGTIKLLQPRIVGVPEPFMLLCHCLGGGLPRDVLRVAWELVTYVQEHGTSRLSPVCEALVAAQVTSKVDATLVGTHRLEQKPAVHELQAWLLEVRREPTEAGALGELCRRAPDRLEHVLSETGHEARSALELLAYCFFAATVLEFFANADPAEKVAAADWDGFLKNCDELGAAQMAFGVHPEAAWRATELVRERLGLAPIPYPKAAPAPAA